MRGKEYVNGRLEFEGEFLYNKKHNGEGFDENGKKIYKLKNGTGNIREYDDEGYLEYEGQYSNGKRNGKGKEYDNNGKFLFEGEYLNGKRNGNGKEYDNNGNLLFEGIYNNGKIWYGKEYKNNRIYKIFEGERLKEGI